MRKGSQDAGPLRPHQQTRLFLPDPLVTVQAGHGDRAGEISACWYLKDYSTEIRLPLHQGNVRARTEVLRSLAMALSSATASASSVLSLMLTAPLRHLPVWEGGNAP